MVRRSLAILGRGAAILAGSVAALAARGPVAPPWDAVAAILQTPAEPSPGCVRYELPRRDLTVRMGDVTLAVPLAATAWVAFAGSAREAVVFGDLIATAEELPGVEAELLHQRLEVTEISDHLAGEHPRLVHLLFGGNGDPVDLARRLDSVLVRTRTPRPVTRAVVPPVTIDTAVTAAALGPGGLAQGNVVRYRVQLVTGRVRWHGRRVPPALASGTALAIQAINRTRAVATADLALLGPQVDPVLRALLAHGVAVEDMHTLDASPPVTFVHAWADGRLSDVAAGLAAALDAARHRR